RPASARAVTIASSSDGWRSTIAAQSAPANPEAPRTATLCTKPPPDRLELALDLGPRGGHLLVGEGALGRAELEPQRERLVARSHLLAVVNVEEVDPVEQISRARPRCRLHRGGGHVL